MLQPDNIVRLLLDSSHLSLKVGTARDLGMFPSNAGCLEIHEAEVTRKPREGRHLLRLSGILCENVFTHFTRDGFPTNFH